jgi:hypothetical protein
LGRRHGWGNHNNVPLFAKLVTLRLRGFADVPRWAPVGLHRLCVYDPRCEVMYRHQSLLVGKVLHNLVVLHDLVWLLLRHNSCFYHRRFFVE